jgi:putative addiction module component (TIGR02574 family)
MSTKALDAALRLPVSERIQLVQEIWDSVVAESAAVPVSKKQKAELDHRLADLAAHPESEQPWSEVRASLKRRR